MTPSNSPSSPSAEPDRAPVLVGWLVTHDDGFEARLGPDKARAEVYVRQHRAVRIEGMFVWRAVSRA